MAFKKNNKFENCLTVEYSININYFSVNSVFFFKLKKNIEKQYSILFSLIILIQEGLETVEAKPRIIVNCFQARLNPKSQMDFSVGRGISHYLFYFIIICLL